MRKCPACGSEVSLQSQFCDDCGTALPVAENAARPGDNVPGFCRACGEPLSPGARFCRRCGASPETGLGPPAARGRRSVAIVSAAIAVVLIGMGLVTWQWWRTRPIPAPIPASSPGAKDYHFARTDVAVKLRPDGSMHVRELRDYVFTGVFHHAFQTFGILPAGTKVRNCVVSEGGVPYRESNDASSHSYATAESGTEFRVDWYFTADNETRAIVLDYDVDGAVIRHADVAELYWQFIGDGFDVQSNQTRVTVEMPEPIPERDIRAWAHGPLWGKYEMQDGRACFTCDPLPRRQRFEVRILFPAQTIAWSPRRDNAAVLGEISAVEAERARHGSDEKLDRDMQQVKVRWPDQQARLLTETDLQNLSAWDLDVVRNEIYARHGRVFEREDLRRYFVAQDWYHPDPHWNPNSLSDMERLNAALILDYQRQHGLVIR